MVTAEQVRRVALRLPRTEEHLIREAVKFRVGRIVYAAVSPDETVLGFAYPREERAALVAAEPDRYHLPIASDLRFNWVRAWLAALDEPLMRELVTEAWRMVVPKKVSLGYDGGGPAGPGRP